MNIFIFIILLFSEIFHGCISSEETYKNNKKPNVLFIIVDDLNDYEGTFGGHPQARTPNIDKLASSGIVFRNAHSNCPLCGPSRASLFTGIYPHNSNLLSNKPPWFDNSILKNCKTLMEYFNENGYYVTGSGKLLHNNKLELWDDWGVEVNNYGPYAFDGFKPVGHPSVNEPFRKIGAVDGSFASLSDVPYFHDSISGGRKAGWIYSTWGGKAKKEGEFLEYKNEEIRDLLPDEMHAVWAANKIKELEKQKNNEPFFMGVGFVRPHTPLYAPKKYFDMFPLDSIMLPVIKENDNADTYYESVYYDKNIRLSDYLNLSTPLPHTIKGPLYYRLLKESYPFESEGLKKFLQAYLACIAFMDDQVGIVLEALAESKFKDNTIVVFVSDHGWNMGEKEYLFKYSLWEESTRIPFIIRLPGNRNNGESVEYPVSLIDVYPTLKDLCNIEGRTTKNGKGLPLDGNSLKSVLDNREIDKLEGRGVLTAITGGDSRNSLSEPSFSLRTRNWRYILYSNGKEELYYHVKDPFEWNNLALDKLYESKKRELKRELLKMIK